MTSEGFVKIHRSILNWQWFSKKNMVQFWLYLLLKANHKDGYIRGIEVKKGQLLTGRKKISEETGLSEQEVKTCLKCLKSTNEITIKTTNKYSLITIMNWDKYQCCGDDSNQQNNQQTNQQTTINQPTSNHQATTNKNVKNNKNDKNIKEKEINKERENAPKVAITRFIKPTIEEIEYYAESIGYKLEGQRFIDYYDSNGWKVGKNHMKDWKATVRSWKRRDEENPKKTIRRALPFYCRDDDHDQKTELKEKTPMGLEELQRLENRLKKFN